FLFGGYRQLAVENLALRQQLAVYKRTTARPKLRTTDRLFWICWLESGPAGGRPWSSCRPTPYCGGSVVASVSTGRSSPTGLGWAVRLSAPRPPPASERWRRPIPCGARQESTESSSSSGSMSPSGPSLAYCRDLADPRRRPGG